MPKIEIDYSNTLVYKIICKDKSVNELYVGHTTNFVQRKYTHKQLCNKKTGLSNCKLYKVIREHGGWDNWEMEILEIVNCKNSIEARIKEQEYYEKLNATLNSVESSIKKKVTMIPKISYEIPKDIKLDIEIFSCKRCGYSTNIKCVFINHLNRKTPCNSILSEIEVAVLHEDFFVLEKKDKPFLCEFCFKGLSSRSGKSQHKKICRVKVLQDQNQKQMIKDLEDQQKQLQDQQQQIEKLEKSIKTINNKTINNKTTNNNNNNNTINNNTVNNIKLNIFGKENLKFLVDEPKFRQFMMRCLTNTDTGYIQLLDKIYFNEKHPENMNIKKTNSKDDFIKCFNGTSWDVMYSDNALEIIMDRISSAFYVFFDWIEENEEDRVKQDIIKTFMQEVGHPLNLDFSGYNYDFLYDKEDNQIRKKKKILQKFCVLNIYNKSVKLS